VICPACEKANSFAVEYSETITPRDGSPSFTVHGLEGEECPQCGEQFVSFDAAKRNAERFAAARAAA
jgi:YgiT-type zinc finger domain-containing protein